MQKKHVPAPLIVILLLAVVVGAYFLIDYLYKNKGQDQKLSGTIEAVSSDLSSELSGRVVEILVEEGDAVNAGDPLFRVDGSILQAQRTLASDALDLANSAAVTADAAAATARANYDSVFSTVLFQSTTARSMEWRGLNPDGYTLPGGTFSTLELIDAAQAEVEAAVEAQSTAQTVLNDLLANPDNYALVMAEKNLLKMRFDAKSAYEVYDKASYTPNTELLTASQKAYNNASVALADAQKAYDKLKETESAVAIREARTAVVMADERVQVAREMLNELQIGEYSPQVQTAQAAMQQAQAAAVQAHQAVTQARDNLALLDAQIAKLTTYAPIPGIVLSREFEVGEVIGAGASAVSVGQLDPLMITVYVSEEDFGKLTLGQPAILSVDAYPNVWFDAAVSLIADEAEYTPRNVQTTEGRKTTVFAVKLTVSNPDGRLKPGMPADILFDFGD